jgi:hypothetical protein
MPSYAHRRVNHPVCLALAALFLSFLVYSAPHQVHHLFEHPHSARPAPCQALAVAKTCHLQVAAPIALSFEENIVQWSAPAAVDSLRPSTASPFSARAPPLA